MLGGVTAVIIAFLGLLWTLGAADITSEFAVFEPNGFATLFPLFGVGFIVIAVCCAVYHFRNAVSKHRYSEYDIVDSAEEPDPLNERAAKKSAFCPGCGAQVEATHRYCASCGKELRS